MDDADVVIVATGFADAIPALKSVGPLAGKVIVDITNPLTDDYAGLTIGHDTSAAEEIAKAFPEAEVVKAFNTLFAQVLAEGASFADGQTAPAFVASDSERAKATATSLAQSIGFDVIDAGPLKNARYLEPLAGLNIYLGYGAGQGTGIAPTWLRRG
jgi:predicted dinucleotide-binding enzyme